MVDNKCLELVDCEGVLPVSHVIWLFERAVNETPSMKKHLSLERDGFQYASEKTRTAFFAFGIGLRCADRIVSVPGKSALTAEVELIQTHQTEN